MKKLKFIAFAMLIATSHTYATSNIENVFPQAGFNRSDDIRVTERNYCNQKMYFLEPFTGAQVNRNHMEVRPNESVTNNSIQPNSLIMHYTVGNFASTVRTFTSNVSAGRVSARYVITEKEANGTQGGSILSIVPEEMRAWHAGVSSFGKIKNYNGCSIGIERVNKGYIVESDERTKSVESVKWFMFDSDQIKSSFTLSKRIVEQYDIKPWNVLGHSDIASLNKQDPGILFPWETLYKDYNVGAFLNIQERSPEIIKPNYECDETLPCEIDTDFTLNKLKQYGYTIDEEDTSSLHNQAIIKAFKAHFSHNMRPEHYNAVIDYDVMFWAWALVNKYGSYDNRNTKLF